MQSLRVFDQTNLWHFWCYSTDRQQIPHRDHPSHQSGSNFARAYLPNRECGHYSVSAVRVAPHRKAKAIQSTVPGDGHLLVARTIFLPILHVRFVPFASKFVQAKR